MKIHKEGYKIISTTLVICVTTIVVINLIFPAQTYFHSAMYLSIAIVIGVVVRFFRIPNRSLQSDSNIILCPADGTIVAIEEVMEQEFFNEMRLQVSVFMSPNNVHVNLYPVSGKIIYTNYSPGSFLVAWHPKSSAENERNTVVIQKDANNSVMVRQIAGALARRIVCYAKSGERITQGCELGFIKFGSRVDLLLPLSSKVLVTLEQKVKGGQTAIARFL
ncbi:MAG: phosphatidylserine decarboxylase family protein [Bacteroidales bacterium]